MGNHTKQEISSPIAYLSRSALPIAHQSISHTPRHHSRLHRVLSRPAHSNSQPDFTVSLDSLRQSHFAPEPFWIKAMMPLSHKTPIPPIHSSRTPRIPACRMFSTRTKGMANTASITRALPTSSYGNTEKPAFSRLRAMVVQICTLPPEPFESWQVGWYPIRSSCESGRCGHPQLADPLRTRNPKPFESVQLSARLGLDD